MLKRPMKAPGEGVSLDMLKRMRYPIACSAKLDGIRGCATYEGIVSATLKPIGNQYIQRKLYDPELLGLDGELIVGSPFREFEGDDVFNRTTGPVRRSDGEPDFKFYVFDDFTDKDISYNKRWISRMGSELMFNNPFVVVLEQRICNSWQEAIEFEEELILQGYEGMMARTLTSLYKEGRVTLKEGHIYKRKPLEQDEAIIMGAYEQYGNLNEKTTSLLGTSTRSSHKENKVGNDTLGGFTLKSDRWEETFNCGTVIGGTKEWRKEIWEQYKHDPYSILGNIVTYVYQGYGSIDKPRQPRCKAEFRAADDITLF